MQTEETSDEGLLTIMSKTTGTVTRVDEKILTFNPSEESGEGVTLEGSVLTIRTPEKTDKVEYPEKFLISQLKAIVGNYVSYKVTYTPVSEEGSGLKQHWKYSLEVLQGPYKGWWFSSEGVV